MEQGKQNEIRRMVNLSRSEYHADGYWVPRSWLNEWKEMAPIGQHEILNPNICESITCEHGALAWNISARKMICTELWSYLRATFPEGPEYPKCSDPCAICKENTDRTVAIMKDRRITRANQKVR